MKSPFRVDVSPDWEGLMRSIVRDGVPERVHFIELFLDPEVRDTVCDRYGLAAPLAKDDPYYALRKEIAVQSFLGYDYVRCSVEGLEFPVHYATTDDTAGDMAHAAGRNFIDEHKGPITTWEEFEHYPWPDVNDGSTRALEFYEKHLPDNMCVVGSGGFAHFAEYLTWLIGYETLCVSLCTNRDLVEAIARRIETFFTAFLERLLAFDRVKIIWGSDDMGYRGGTLISPEDTREFMLRGHTIMAEMSHAAGRPYILHSCGNLEAVMDDLIDVVKIDGKHSFEDTIEDVRVIKNTYGRKIALLGGIDVDFLCRADEQQVRDRVRDTLDKCMPGGGYCLGTGNSVANYIPLENYLAMLDEGRKYGA